MGRAKKNVEVEAQVIARGNVVPMMTETESEETVQYVSDEDAAREDTRRGLSRQRRARAWPITHSRNSLLRSVTMTCSKIPLYAMSFLPGAVTQKRFATVMPVPCQIMVRTMFVLPVRRERTLFSSRLLKAVALANRAIRMSSIK